MLLNVLGHIRHDRAQMTGVDGISGVGRRPSVGLEDMVPLSTNSRSGRDVDHGLRIWRSVICGNEKLTLNM